MAIVGLGRALDRATGFRRKQKETDQLAACVIGPIRVFGESYLDFYKRMSEIAGKHFTHVSATYPDFWQTDETPADLYKRTCNLIANQSVCIVEVTCPSSSVGVMMQLAQEFDIPCILLCKEGTEPSPMILGIPCAEEVLLYKDINDAIKQIEPYLREYAR